MYWIIDSICWAFSTFMIANGCYVKSGSSSMLGIDSPTFWIVTGVGSFLMYPVLLESILYICSPEEPKPKIDKKIAISYSPQYNITAFGIEKCHPFDSEKYRKIHEKLCVPSDYLIPRNCPRSLLLGVHSFLYLLSLNYSLQISRMVEIPVFFLPSFILRWRVLDPMLHGTHGSILAGCAAVENKKYGINLSGGYHHASSTSGGGFCIYADITLTIYWLRKWYPNTVKKVMIIDLDAHQGNGHERDFLSDDNVFIIDFYNAGVYPNDTRAKFAIKYEENFNRYDDDNTYLTRLENALSRCIKEFNPDFIVYNAGTDCMAGDPLGNLNLSDEGIIKRDEKVFKYALTNEIPILMLLSGGYQPENAPVIARSINNLISTFNLLS
jgi:histone deacetylase 11